MTQVGAHRAPTLESSSAEPLKLDTRYRIMTMAEAREAELEAALTDDEGEGSSQACDSEYGLSDRQLEDFWHQLGEREHVVSEFALHGDDDAQNDRTDYDFGLCSQQIACLGRRCSDGEDPLRRARPCQAEPAPAPRNPLQNQAVAAVTPATRLSFNQDPLRHFLMQRKEGNDVPSAGRQPSQRESRQPAVNQRQALSQRDCPVDRRHHKKAHMVSSRTIDGSRWYLFRIHDKGEIRFYMKRYSDFSSLHSTLEEHRHRRHRPIPELPESGLFGIRQMLDVGDFNVQRQAGLERYVDVLFHGLSSLSEDPVLEAFFGPAGSGRVYDRDACPMNGKPVS